MENITSLSSAVSNTLVTSIVLDFFMTFNLLILGEIIGILGIVSNIINIRIFYMMGFQESVDITLTALAVSDLGSLVTIQLTNVMANPWCLSSDLPFIPLDILTLLSFYPHNYFIRVSGFITSFAAFERCLSVVLPLKVKRLITCRTSLSVNIAIFVLTVFNVFSPYFFSYLGWSYVPALNKTVLGLSMRGDWETGLSVSYLVTDLFVPYFTFFVLITCTAIIAAKLNSRTIWRSSLSSAKKSVSGRGVSVKEKKAVRMLMVVAVIFIFCLTPQSAILTAVAVVSDLGLNGAYFDVAFLCYCFSYLTETVCSSVNIIIYYNMSSKYRQTFRNLFFERKH